MDFQGITIPLKTLETKQKSDVMEWLWLTSNEVIISLIISV